MPTKYTMQEKNDLNQPGETLLVPKMILTGRLQLNDLARIISTDSTYSAAEVKGILDRLCSKMADYMAAGFSITIDGLGTFTPGLRLKRGRERELPTGKGGRRNAASIEIGAIHFRVDRELLRETNSRCTLERSSKKFKRHVSPYTPEQRLELARQFLDTYPVLTLNDYARLTGLSRTACSVELRRWNSTPGSGIEASGMGSHRVYVKSLRPSD